MARKNWLRVLFPENPRIDRGEIKALGPRREVRVPGEGHAWCNEGFIMEQVALLEEMKGHHDDAFDELVSERQNVRKGLEKTFRQRDELCTVFVRAR